VSKGALPSNTGDHLDSSHATFTIKQWHGRLGNRFVAVHNAVSLAVCCRGVVVLPESGDWPHLPRRIDLSYHLPAGETGRAATSGCNNSLYEATDKFSFYTYASHLPHAMQDAMHSCKYEHALLMSLFFGEAPSCSFACEKLHPERLVIHIRSGDIFESGKANSDYFQYPVAFYASVISRRAWTEVVFVTDH
jgi:hypothetical protein